MPSLDEALAGYAPPDVPMPRKTAIVDYSRKAVERRKREAAAASARRATDIADPAQRKANGRDALDFANPLLAAQTFVLTRHMSGGHRTLHYWQGEFHIWTGSHYEVLPQPDLRESLYRVGAEACRNPVKKTAVDNVLDALRAVVNVSHRDVPCTPAWLHHQSDDPDARSVIPVANGLLRIADSVLLPPNPRLFVPCALPFTYRADQVPEITEWNKFLASVWQDDQVSIDCLQEWLGYLLTADTSMQKALMIVGPKRSGKGTIGRLIVQLLGVGNVASSTLASLGREFGLQVLIGKTAVLVSDARLGGRADIAAIAENLLRITGEDAISVERKFLPAYTARMLTRFVLLTNELPAFRDASTALPSRFVILQMTRSFLGREDHDLDKKLAAELPGILAWALVGLRRLLARGRFTQPPAAMNAMQMMEDLASPIGAFLRERCILESGGIVPVQSAYSAWCGWCESHGRDQPGTEQAFGRDLAAAAPQVRSTQKRTNSTRTRFYVGLRLRDPDDPDAEDDELF